MVAGLGLTEDGKLPFGLVVQVKMKQKAGKCLHDLKKDNRYWSFN